MTENDRLVHQHANGWFSTPYATGKSKYWTNANKGALMERLGEYEDTGYSPEELRGILRKSKVAPGDRVAYAGGVWEVTGFDLNAVCLQSVNDDRHHEVDQLLFMFRDDYRIEEGWKREAVTDP